MSGRHTIEWRFGFVVAVILLVAALIIGRLFFLQITSAGYYRDRADMQHTAFKIKVPHRGSIFFEDKAGRLTPAAVTKTSYTLYINPVLVKDSHAAYEVIQDAVSFSDEEFEARLQDTSAGSRILARGLEREPALSIAEKAPPGIYLGEEDTRVYPGGALASHVLGFMGYVGDERKGRYGVEEYYEETLAGALRDESSRSFPFSLSFLKEQLMGRSNEGADIVLTIDPKVQSFIEKRMAVVRERWGAESAGALILDPKTGKILAMGAVPSFDPNAYNKEHNYDIFINPFMQKIHEMGSVFKPLTMAAALDAGVVRPETTYNDEGRVIIAGKVIENFDGKARGIQTMLDVLEQSLNTGAVYVMRRLGGERLEQYFQSFGLGEFTGIDLPNEVRGNLKNLSSGQEIEYATASFGQGIAVTHLELATALAALGNGGEVPRPYIVSRVAKDGVTLTETQPRMRQRAIRTETSETISRMLTSVVDNALAGGVAKLPDYSLAAKTGTAQILAAGGKGYSQEYLHTYFGYGPSFDPQFLILLYLERPHGIKYSSQSLTDTFREIVKFLINYYEIPPDRAPAT